MHAIYECANSNLVYTPLVTGPANRFNHMLTQYDEPTVSTKASDPK